MHPQDEPFLNKPIKDHDLFEIICGNDQEIGWRVIHFGDEIGTNIYNSVESYPQFQTGGLEDMSFEETDFHVNVSTLIHNQS